MEKRESYDIRLVSYWDGEVWGGRRYQAIAEAPGRGLGGYAPRVVATGEGRTLGEAIEGLERRLEKENE